MLLILQPLVWVSHLQLDEYQLVWSDEFSRPGKPDPKKWIYELGFVRNKELQYYRKENVRVEGGVLIIEGRKELVPNEAFDSAAPIAEWKKSRKDADYTSGSIKTATLHTWTYGRFICRGKFTTTLGLWPAFWMTGPTRAWPANGEIDIMEYYQHQYLANVAWGSSSAGAAKWRSTYTPIAEIAKGAGFSSVEAWEKEFHIYQMDWDKASIKLYVDGRLLNNVSLSETVNESADHANPFHEKHHLILNLAIGATGGDPTNTSWPSQFVVDYVRVYQKKPEPIIF